MSTEGKYFDHQPRLASQGQALIETTGALFLLLPITVFGLRILGSEWEQTRCLHQAFEHSIAAALNEWDPNEHASDFYQITRDTTTVHSRVHCSKSPFQLQIEVLH